MNAEISEQLSTLSPLVQYWIKWMSIIFICSVFFVWKRTAARYVLLSIPLLIAIGMTVFHFTHNAHLLGVAHLVVWTPLFFYLFKYEVGTEGFSFKSVYGVWLGLLMTTITISLVFDVRDVVLVTMGQK